MSAHGFRSVYMAASVVGAALGCYLISLNVASERAKLENVEAKIVLAQRDIRVLQTEIGTRGRLAQLERWNARFIRLSAPSADQFVEGGFQLAALARPDKQPVIQAPVVLASVPAEQSITRPVTTSDSDEASPPAIARRDDPSNLMHTASLANAERTAGPRANKPIVAVTAKTQRRAMADPLAPLPGPAASSRLSAPTSLAAKPKDRSTAQ